MTDNSCFCQPPHCFCLGESLYLFIMQDFTTFSGCDSRLFCYNKKMNKQWNQLDLPEIFSKLETTKRGLSSVIAKDRINKYGYNKLPEAKTDSAFIIFARQFQSPLIYILFLAGLVVYLMGEKIDALIIFGILLFNSIVGSIQEGRAQNTLLALRKFTETKATVFRDEKEIIIPDTELVRGDIVILQEGDKVPADGVVVLSENLKIDEAALTGESESVIKLAHDDAKNKRNENKSILFKGTHVIVGSGEVVVTETGTSTVIGDIAKGLKLSESEIPLKTDIRNLSRFIVYITTAISFLLFVAGIVSGRDVVDMFTIVVSLAVSVIPEGLPIVMTLVLAGGVYRMSKKNALVKRLQAVEVLGQAKVIAVDKTGTITRNELVVEEVYIYNKTFRIKGLGYEPKGKMFLNDIEIDPSDYSELEMVGRVGSLCSKAHLMYSDEIKEWIITGDPTQAAMLVLSKKMGIHREDLLIKWPLLKEEPFDYKLSYSYSVNLIDEAPFLSIVGAPEVILKLSNKIWKNGEMAHLSGEDKKELEKTFFDMSKRGLRVVAAGFKSVDDKDETSPKIDDLVFVGFLGMKDALRYEVKESIKQAVGAGIKVVMITGDHRITAESIAGEAGIYHHGDVVITGQEIDQLSDDELSEKLINVSVFARVNPEHKLRIIEAYKKRGEIIAMTGDGINDALSLVAADLGVAMGKIGTEVAKEASDIILLDDNFKSIVSAIEEGRGIYRTIKKVILYLFSTSVGEVLVIAGAMILGMSIPLLPSQIIWLNFVTDGFLVLALALDPKDNDLLSGKFDKRTKYLVDKSMLYRMFILGIPMAVGTLLLFNYYFVDENFKAWTVSLTVLAVFQWFNAWNCRSEKESIFGKNIFSNKWLILATGLVVISQIFAIYNPFMQGILHTVPLGFNDWIVVISMASSIVFVEEFRKIFSRFNFKKTSSYQIITS